MKKLFQISTAILFSVLVISGCGDSDNNDTDSTATPTGTVNGGTDNGNGDNGNEGSEWTRIRTHHRSDMVVEGQCRYPWILTIQHSGSFNGNCNGKRISGRLTADELEELDNRADRVASDVSARTCDDIAPIVETYHQITVSRRGTFRFFDVDIEDAEICFRGGQEDAQNLEDYLVNTILPKYFHP